jgi:hypothetical protein
MIFEDQDSSVREGYTPVPQSTSIIKLSTGKS